MSVYKVIEVIGTSSTSWEDAAAEAVRTTAETIRDLRVAEVVKQDVHLDESGVITYRTKLQLSFKVRTRTLIRPRRQQGMPPGSRPSRCPRPRRWDHEIENQQGDRDREHAVAEGLQPPGPQPAPHRPRGSSPLVMA
jgi:dodecin